MGDHDGDADEDGCPEGGEGDRDGDSIVDSMDTCPDEPEDRDGFQDEDGCPDEDNEDGRLDLDDLCPNDPEDMDDFQGELCPLVSGHDAAAWETNRRVELTIRASDSGNATTGAPCPAGRDYMP